MVLSMADFGKSWQSLQTLWNASRTVLKLFVTACVTVCVDLEWIRKGRKLADFEQKASTIAHRFWTWPILASRGNAANSLKRLQNRSKIICDCSSRLFVRFKVNSQGSKFGRLGAKGLGYNPQVLNMADFASPVNRSTLSETPPNPF